MTSIDGYPCASWQTAWPHGVTAAGACAEGGINEHRLYEQPVVVGLLGEVPGSVPYSTHLEIAAARARLVHRAVENALAGLGARQVDFGEISASERLQESGPEAGPRMLPRAGAEPNMDRVERGVLYTQPRRRWPIGGLIDLVI